MFAKNHVKRINSMLMLRNMDTECEWFVCLQFMCLFCELGLKYNIYGLIKVVLLYAKQATWKHRWPDVESLKKYLMYTGVEVFELRGERLSSSWLYFIHFSDTLCISALPALSGQSCFHLRLLQSSKTETTSPTSLQVEASLPCSSLAGFLASAFFFFFLPFSPGQLSRSSLRLQGNMCCVNNLWGKYIMLLLF